MASIAYPRLLTTRSADVKHLRTAATAETKAETKVVQPPQPQHLLLCGLASMDGSAAWWAGEETPVQESSDGFAPEASSEPPTRQQGVMQASAQDDLAERAKIKAALCKTLGLPATETEKCGRNPTGPAVRHPAGGLNGQSGHRVIARIQQPRGRKVV